MNLVQYRILWLNPYWIIQSMKFKQQCNAISNGTIPKVSIKIETKQFNVVQCPMA